LKGEDALVKRHAAKALGKIGDRRAVNPLIRALEDEDEWVPTLAEEALVRIGKPAVGSFVEVLGEKNIYLRWRAAKALGEIGDTWAVRPLIRVLNDKDASVLRHAIQALGQIGDAKAVRPLIRMLRHNDGSVRRQAAEALGEIGETQAVKPLSRAQKKDDSWVVQAVAQEALGKILSSKNREDT
jgi:HEAT repeat protein